MSAAAPSTVVLYLGHSQYESVGTMVRQLATAFARAGLAPVLLDTRTPDCIAEAVRLARSGTVRFFLSLNGYGVPAAGQGAGFYAETAAPLLVYFVDHPAYHYRTIRCVLPRFAATFPTAHHLRFCSRHIRGDIALRHLPHAAEPLAEPPPAWETRDISLLLSASLPGEPEALRAGWRQHGAAVEQSLNDIVAAHDAAATEPLDAIIARSVGRDDLPIEVFASYFIAADTYLRSRVKHAFAAALLHRALTVCGEGWDALAQESAAGGGMARFLPSQNALETMMLMRRAKLVLNPLPAYYDSHERPLQAMAAGAVAATGPSNFFGAPEFAGALLALPAEPPAAAARLEAALGDDASLAAIAAAGTRVQAAAHRWDDRARSLIELADSIAAR